MPKNAHVFYHETQRSFGHGVADFGHMVCCLGVRQQLCTSIHAQLSIDAQVQNHVMAKPVKLMCVRAGVRKNKLYCLTATRVLNLWLPSGWLELVLGL